MEPGRIWQRGASKARKGSTNARLMRGAQNDSTKNNSNDFGDDDTMMSALQRSLIAETLQGARAHVSKASLNEPSRPFTPGDLPRHLFHGNDYTNRPGSSYKMNNVIGQAADEFASSFGNTSGANFSGIKTQANTNSEKSIGEDVLSILERHQPQSRGGMPSLQGQKGLRAVLPGTLLPSLDPQQFQKRQSVKQNSDFETKSFQQEKALNVGDFHDLIKNQEKVKEVAEGKRSSIKTEFEQLMTTMKPQQQKEQDEDEDWADELQDQMTKDLFQEADKMGIFQFEIVDYAAVLKQIEEHVPTKQIVQKEENDELYDQAIDDEGNVLGGRQPSPYEAEYFEVISSMSQICRQIISRKARIEESEIFELAPRISALALDHDKQNEQDRQKCFLQTLLKGSFSLLGVKLPKCALKISACNIQIFFKILDQLLKKQREYQLKHKMGGQEMIQELGRDIDFVRVFNYLYETMRGLLIYAKEGDFDAVFVEESLVPLLAQVILRCYCEYSELIVTLTSQLVNKKLIANDDKMYDLMNYVIGTIKCFTQTSKEVQRITVQSQMISVLSKALHKTFVFGGNQNKQSMILVQISGALRNLANVEDSYGLLLTCKVLPKLCEIYGDPRFRGHKELILNVSRLLSKVSIDFNCAEQMVNTKNTPVFLESLERYKENSAVLIRIAFVLGNLTTHYEQARHELCQVKNCFQRVISLAQFYLEKDLAGASQMRDVPKDAKAKKYEEFSAGNIEDAITKIIKLLANLATEEEFAHLSLLGDGTQELIGQLVQAVDKRTIDSNEEFILNAISCTTNLLFYDLPQRPILNDEIRISIFNSIKLYILATQNEEIQIETVRVLSNLSRHATLCDEFVSDPTFLEALLVVLDHTLRDLVFYSVGIIINITLHDSSRLKIFETENVVSKLIDVLRDSNIEDIDLSKVAAKALHNLTQFGGGQSENNNLKISDYWSNQNIKKLEEVLQNLGDELDSIMDVASDRELEEIQSLRKLINDVNNDMPEPTVNCPEEGCGRKFKNKDELDNHLKRRHSHK